MFQGQKVMRVENVKTGFMLWLADGRRVFVSR